MTDLKVRCPGTNGNGCEAMVSLDADVCFTCGTEFHGSELLELFVREYGWMEAEAPA